MLIYRLADRLHKLPSEIMEMDPEEMTYFLAYSRIAAEEEAAR
jgi:hypothetical protein